MKSAKKGVNDEETPSQWADRFFIRGRPIRISGGQTGIFLEKMAGKFAKILNANDRIDVVSFRGLVDLNWNE